MAAKFTDIFERIDLPRFHFGRIEDHPILDAYYRPGRFGWRKVISRAREHPHALHRGPSLLPGINLEGARFYLQIGNKAILSTCHEFFAPGNWGYFVPIERLRNRIDEIAAGFGPACTGIHIRRTDHISSREKSPLDVFLVAMKQELSRDPSTKFFLATDSDDVRTALIHIFGDTIMTQAEAELSRRTKSGVADAVVDMWCLSRTQRILGSYRSSFSYAAAQIGHITLTRCSSEPESRGVRMERDNLEQ